MWGRDHGRCGVGARTVLLALALLLAAGAANAYTNITRAEAWDRIQAGGDLVVLDVREYIEFCGFSEHIENAVCLPWTSGVLILDWMLRSLAERSLPDFGIATYLSPQTLVIALIVGVVAVAVAPLFLVRGVRKMNLPDTLRVME